MARNNVPNIGSPASEGAGCRSRVWSAALRGTEAVPVEVEAVVSRGLPGLTVIGLPGQDAHETEVRVRAAMRRCGFVMPDGRVVANLSPCGVKKQGGGFDLPVAAAILAATGQIPDAVLDGLLLAGGLSPQGEVVPVNGLPAYADCARRLGCGGLLAARTSAPTLRLDGIVQLGVGSLSDLRDGAFPLLDTAASSCEPAEPDFCEIAGHEREKRALQIAAAGRHGLLLTGPRGSGKAMLAMRLPSILPSLSEEQRFEAAVAHSVAGRPVGSVMRGVAPLRSPHWTASLAGLVGGGVPPSPGEASLAHNGVLFLDGLSEFAPSALESIRCAYVNEEVVLACAGGTVSMPSRFLLVAASEPCPCGNFGSGRKDCRCAASQVRAYRNRVGGPLRDCLGMHVEVQEADAGSVLSMEKGTCSATLKDGVEAARDFARWRLGDTPSASADDVVASCRLDDVTLDSFELACAAERMSGREIIQSLSVARTIADLGESERVTADHLAEAMQYRLRDL